MEISTEISKAILENQAVCDGVGVPVGSSRQGHACSHGSEAEAGTTRS